MTWQKQTPCPCGVHSSAVCAYANTRYICNGRPDMRITDEAVWKDLIAYFESKRKKKT